MQSEGESKCGESLRATGIRSGESVEKSRQYSHIVDLKSRMFHTTQGEFMDNNNQYMAQKKMAEKKISPFVSKLIAILDDPESKACIEWVSPESFSITEPNTFSKKVLPRYYKHHNLSSFIRQLNIYGFNKLKSSEQEQIYSHPNFVRANRKKLRLIQRRYNLKVEDRGLDGQAKEMQETNVSLVKNITALKNENQQYRLKNKLIQEQINKLTEQRSRQVQNITNFFCSILDNDFQSPSASLEEHLKTIIYTLQQINLLKQHNLLNSEQRIEKMILYLSEKKNQLLRRLAELSGNCGGSGDGKLGQDQLESLDHQGDGEREKGEEGEKKVDQMEECQEYFSSSYLLNANDDEFHNFLDTLY